MSAVRLLALACALAIPGIASADVTVIYAPASPSTTPLVARPVCPTADRATADGATADAATADAATAERAADAATTTERTTAAVEPISPRSALAPPLAPPLPLAPPAALAPAPAPSTATPSADAPAAPPAAPTTTTTRPPTPPPEPTPVASHAPSPCAPPVVIVRVRDGRHERASLPLLGCDGRPDPESLVALSVLARPRDLTSPPTLRELAAHAADDELVAPGVRRLHAGLLERLRAIADRFPGHAIEIVSGFRPAARRGSRHLVGLALDLRVVGASLDAVHALVSRFDRTGVGLYPASGFLHVDVRERSTRWVDESGPGEPPRIVRTDEPARGARVRSAVPVERRPARTPARAPSAVEDDAEPTDADAIADEILRGFGDLPLPPPPSR